MSHKETVQFYQQNLGAVPRSVSQDIADLGRTSAIKIEPLVVVGLKLPGTEALRAADYSFTGKEAAGSITLDTIQAERLARVYNMTMVERQKEGYIECGSVVNFVMGWRDDPYARFGDTDSGMRVYGTDEPLPEPLTFASGRPHAFNSSKGGGHIVFGTDDPGRNLSKLGTFGPFTTLSHTETASFYNDADAFEIVGLQESVDQQSR
jgi:hypothetical protein